MAPRKRVTNPSSSTVPRMKPNAWSSPKRGRALISRRKIRRCRGLTARLSAEKIPAVETPDGDRHHSGRNGQQHTDGRQNLDEGIARPKDLRESLHRPVDERELAHRLHERRHEADGKPGASAGAHD